MIIGGYMDKIEISGFEYIGPELTFRVDQDLWRESDEHDMPIRWVPTKPSRYISYMEHGTVFLFSGIYIDEGRDIVHFIAVPPGPESIIDEVELTIDELESLTESRLLRFLDVKDVKEISITPAGTLVEEPEGWTFKEPVYLPSDVYIVMGKQEYRNSGGKLGVGQKISLRHLLEVYSIAIKQGLILK